MRTALYTRVSTQHQGQETANQLLQLRECCQGQSWLIVREYEDHESGVESELTALQQMLRDARLTASQPGVVQGAVYPRRRRILPGLKDSPERTLDYEDRSETWG